MTGIEPEYQVESVAAQELVILVNPNAQDESGLQNIGFDYQTALVDAEEITGLCDSLFALLFDGIMKPHEAVFELSIMSEKERNKLVVEFNQTLREMPDITYQEIFDRQVLKTPNNIAVVCNSDQLTYGRLNAKGKQAGRSIKGQGSNQR